MIKFASRNPWTSSAIVLALACVVWGPSTVGSWMGVHGRLAVVYVIHFGGALVSGAF